jgi:NDP-sugar pyrophosphorylase family protein
MILAGGLGTRLRPVLSDRPKGLAPVGERPFLEIQIELLRRQGARWFVLCVGHLADHIEAHFRDGSRWGVRIDYSVEGERLLGTGGALKLAECYFRPRALVLNGDTYLAVDYTRLLQCHHEERARAGVLATLTLARAADATRFGTVQLDAAGSYVTAFREKEAAPPGAERWLNAGAYVIEKDLLEFAPPRTPASLERDLFPRALAAGGRLAAETCGAAFYDIGTPEGLRTLTEHYRAA